MAALAPEKGGDPQSGEDRRQLPVSVYDALQRFYDDTDFLVAVPEPDMTFGVGAFDGELETCECLDIVRCLVFEVCSDLLPL